MSSAEVLASVDIVALRLTPGHGLELLLIRRAQAPFAGQWALPGVLVNGRSADHSLDDAAVRALRDKARLEPAYIEQVATVGNAVRDPRGWSLSVFYLVLVGPDTRVEDDDLDFVPLRDVRSERFALPFDHAQLVQQACERLASKSVYSALPLFLLAPRFTVAEALKAFECAIGQEVQHSSLRGRLERMKEAGWVEDTGERQRPPMGRPQHVLHFTPKPGGAFVFDRSLLAS
ncbi:NUDIX hydrolase [Pseudomonas aeruginosa]|uniref:NUDIX domain-containing protein n=1 Tax=Pseudomonas TaxID=286 RepID=UPI0003B96AD9|nr:MULTISPECIES: NUDIX hydrolase [Pseudomonas]ARN53091.1 NUDIX hydrolase [Pseudomonas aeruginosa]EIU4986398.1 NUDIX hydrolase [Pseudomonas aeruginosa]EIY2605124.1 NUDIX hydrolase [Pseudomonas aeruginosa]EIY2734967.1 NUDIX hydrolase [Pseudomonas aeruginosa]EIY2740177.1 NUDIX hydrolase [Pseudomonas aeruginosa]